MWNGVILTIKYLLEIKSHVYFGTTSLLKNCTNLFHT